MNTATSRRTIATAAVTAAIAALTPATAIAASGPDTTGGHVSECAKSSLGQRPAPPSVECTHEDESHEFGTFGEMVGHMRDHDHD